MSKFEFLVKIAVLTQILYVLNHEIVKENGMGVVVLLHSVEAISMQKELLFRLSRMK